MQNLAPYQCGASKMGTSYIAPNQSATQRKPWITQDDMGNFYLNYDERNADGSTFTTVTVDFTQVYVASQTDTATHINAMLEQYDYVVLQPGAYELDKPIQINKPG